DVASNRVFSCLGENRLVERKRVGDFVVRNAADRTTGVTDDVIAGDHCGAQQIEANFFLGSPEVDDRLIACDAYDLSRHPKTHGSPPLSVSVFNELQTMTDDIPACVIHHIAG